VNYWLPLPFEVARDAICCWNSLSFKSNKRESFPLWLAYVSVSLDFHQGREATISGWAEQWSWSRGKVRRFLEAINVELLYPENKGKKLVRRGHIVVHEEDREQSVGGQVKLLKLSKLSRGSDSKRTDFEQQTDSQCSTPMVKGLEVIKKNKNPTTKNLDSEFEIEEYLSLGSKYGSKGNPPNDPSAWQATVGLDWRKKGSQKRIDPSC